MPSTVPVRPSRDARPVLLFFICLTVLALIAQTWWAIVQDRQLTIESEIRNSSSTVRSLEENTTRVLQEVDHVLAGASAELHGLDRITPAQESQLHRMLVEQRDTLQALSALWIVDPAGGNWATTSRFPARRIDFSGHKFIKFLNEHPEHRQTMIGLPIQSGYDNAWLVPLARNLYDANNRHVGIIGASVPAGYFVDFYKRVLAGRDASVTLRTNEGFVLLRLPFEEKSLGKDVSATSIFQMIEKGGIEGAFEDVSVFDRRHRLFSYSKTFAFPIVTVYSVDIESVLLAWKSRSLHRVLSTGATVLFIGILAFVLLLHIRRSRASEYRLTASENRYRMLYEGASDGVFLMTRKQVVVDCNNAAVALLGVGGKQQIIGRSLRDFSPADRSPAAVAERQREIDAALDGQPQQFEWPIERNGRLSYNEVTLTRVEVGRETLLLCMFRDIDARKQSEELQKGQNEILHIIAGGDDLQKILNEIILFAEQQAPHAKCMVLLQSEDGTKLIWGGGPSIPERMVQKVSDMRIKQGNGAASEVVLTQYPVIVANIAIDPSMRHVSDVFAANGFVACGCWPIMGKRGQVLGAFSMLYGEPRTPSAADVQLVGISTDLAGIAIESRWAEERIRHLAHYDELTGLPNRFLYIQYLNKALAHAERQQQPVGVLYLDLDRFKNINDTFGHEAGDTVLRNVAAQFRRCLRDTDSIARVGGDEFIVLVESYVDPRHLGEIAERLLIEAAKPFDIHDQECQLSASIGIATYPMDGANAQSLLKNADIAMYRAKTTGKNNYQFYSSEMNTHTVERLALETRLRRAIERREFVVHYQPKLDVRTGQIVGAEALVRWQHPEKGLLLPSSFIPLAEEVGLIGALGMLVLDAACSDIQAFTQAGISFGRVAINLSGSQFTDTHLLSEVKNVIDARQIDPGLLEFEITESMVMHNRDQAIESMDGIKALGFSLSIDDFGTGYSSLAYLKRFPVDSVKVDKSFINDIPQDPNDSAIVQAIIVMAHTLGLKVTAEGVETAIQLDTLKRFGCDEYQGFYFSRAIPGKEFIALVQHQSQVAVPAMR
jgi:diguanylate cyclase (GGDEF)-like protein/PAS domain S-box-containing protein